MNINILIPLLVFMAFTFASSDMQAQQATFNDELPDDFTTINVEVYGNPQPGEYIFFAWMGQWNQYPDLTPYLVITDN